jgi:hypothetical protein
MGHKKILLGVILFTAVLLLSACAASGPDKAIAAFWQALVAKDSAQVSSLSCAAYEPEAQTTLESFNAVETKLKDLVCSVNTQEGDNASVSCTGSIIATYGSEDMTIDLSARTYTAKKEGGDWRMCGAE